MSPDLIARLRAALDERERIIRTLAEAYGITEEGPVT